MASDHAHPASIKNLVPNSLLAKRRYHTGIAQTVSMQTPNEPNQKSQMQLDLQCHKRHSCNEHTRRTVSMWLTALHTMKHQHDMVSTKEGVVLADASRSAFAVATQRLASIQASQKGGHTETEDVEMLPGVQDLIEGLRRRRARRATADDEAAEEVGEDTRMCHRSKRCVLCLVCMSLLVHNAASDR